jgi:hypothetical protein
MMAVGRRGPGFLQIFRRFPQDENAGCNVSVSRGCLMTAVARTKLASPYQGTMLAVVAYTPDMEDHRLQRLTASAVWLRAALPGKS